ncbi:MAG: DUF2079 domain-containing protein, partial [Actinobacteria bacterium]|nr:DUF2079 domain-containing protein [Actinomycetota bacterium]
PRVGARVGVGVAAATYIALFSYWSVKNHQGFGTAGFDLGLLDQGVWLLSVFKAPFVTIMGLDLLGDHTSFILLFLVPFYWLFDSAAVLLVAQSVALGAAAIPLFMVAREKLRDEFLALLVAVAYLVHPATGWINTENFHPDSFDVPLVFLAFYFVMLKRWTWFYVSVALLLMVKEDVALFTLPLGIYVAFAHDRRVGLITSVASMLWFVAAFLLILPGINGAGTMDANRLPFGGLGGTLKAIFTHPWEVVSLMISEDRPWYLWQLVVPTAFLAFLAPEVLGVAVGSILSNVISTFPYQHSIQYHYSTLILPVTLVAAVYGISRIGSFRLKTGLATVLFAFAFTTGYMWGPSQFAREPVALADPSTPEAAAKRQAMEMVPDDATISAFYTFVPHLS